MGKKDSTDTKTENTTVNEEEVIKIIEEDEVAVANKQADEFKLLAQRVQAEFDNYRKRNNESVKNARFDGVNDIAIEILPILDNFERAIAAIQDESNKNGVELIQKQLQNMLAKFDVIEMVALGEEFNPTYHHAIAQCEDSERANKVVEVFQKGYIRKDKVLRPAMVKVAQ